VDKAARQGPGRREASPESVERTSSRRRRPMAAAVDYSTQSEIADGRMDSRCPYPVKGRLTTQNATSLGAQVSWSRAGEWLLDLHALLKRGQSHIPRHDRSRVVRPRSTHPRRSCLMRRRGCGRSSRGATFPAVRGICDGDSVTRVLSKTSRCVLHLSAPMHNDTHERVPPDPSGLGRVTPRGCRRVQWGCRAACAGHARRRPGVRAPRRKRGMGTS